MSKAQKFLVMKGGFNLTVKDFTQSLGAELLLNGNFANWTGIYPTRDPDNWTVSGETVVDPEISEVGAGEGHGGAGTGACNFFASATSNQPRITQNILTSGNIYEYLFSITNRVAGNIATGSSGNPSANNFTLVSPKYQIVRASAVGFQVLAGTAATDVTVDDFSVKQVTLNATQVIPANAQIDVYFPAPGAPVANQEMHLLYRVSGGAAGAFLNCWDLFLRRNAANADWDVVLQSITAGVRGAGTSATGVGTVTGLRVVANGNTHTIYTYNGTTWTARGSVVSSASFNGATGCLPAYNSGFAPTLLQIAA